MSKIRIGTSENRFCDVNESWIHREVRERQKDGQSVCAQVTLKGHSVDMILSTPQCSRGHGGGRRPNEKEERVFKLWENEHLNEVHWTADDLISFVKKVHRLVC